MATHEPEAHPNLAQEIPLEDQAEYMLQEARVVLPGIQALFGFQLIAVFSQGFRDLGPSAQRTHLASLLLVTIAIALVMTPPIFHRIAEHGRLSVRFVEVASRVIAWAMGPLAIGITLEVGLVTWVISASAVVVAIVGACTASLSSRCGWSTRGRSGRAAEGTRRSGRRIPTRGRTIVRQTPTSPRRTVLEPRPGHPILLEGVPR